ncbi:hypothetical protein [Stenomitos frigidus]|uniref:Uncharacterized protein n=1 Tax=Stenomitos frigidus ULC18 TaxID=2107698 RepID=A0A2T1E0K1_9CYAN|nr:hypothetical protein [Stenomitos frigidus]PSB26211.1 hypothetical protein C7B82_20545 [Stenomitos frigidus ULC18]
MPPASAQTDYCTRQWVEQYIADSLTHAIECRFKPLLERQCNTAIVDAVAASKRETHRAISGFAARLFHQLPQLIARTLQSSNPDFLIDSEALAGQLQTAFEDVLAVRKKVV